MWIPVELEIKRFKSHLHTRYVFLQGKTVVIYGSNLDDEGADSNGSGKSSMVEAFTVCVAGIFDKDLGKDELVMDGYKDSELRLVLDNRMLKMKMEIKRRLFTGSSSSKLELIMNGVPDTNIASVPEGEKKILEHLDISREDLLNYYIINQENSSSFFKATDMKQKEIISRFTNSTLVEAAEVAVQEDLDRVIGQIQVAKDEQTAIELRIQFNEEQIEYERDVREQEEAVKLADLMEDIVAAKNAIVKRQKSLKESKDLVASTQKKYDESLVDAGDIGTKKLTFLSQKREKGEWEEQSGELAIAIADFQKLLAGEVTCPKCKHKWSLSDPKQSLTTVRKSLKEYEETLSTVDATIGELEESIDTLRKSIRNTELQGETAAHLSKRIGFLNDTMEDHRKFIKAKTTFIAESQKKISVIRQFKKDTQRIQELQAKQDEEAIKHGQVQEIIDELEQEKAEYEYWKVNLGMSGFQTFLINKVLENIEGYVNFHLKKFKTNLLVRIEGFKRLKSGKVSEKINVLVTKDGEVWKKFKRFSGGQKERINVCGVLTLQKLINMSSKSGGLDFLGLDEFFEGLDRKGQMEVLKILKLSGVTTMIISHNNNEIGWENSLHINYKNSISTIVS